MENQDLLNSIWEGLEEVYKKHGQGMKLAYEKYLEKYPPEDESIKDVVIALVDMFCEQKNGWDSTTATE